jgi:hypothetical protein
MRFQSGLNGRFGVERFQVRAAEQTEAREVDNSRCGIGSVLFCELQNVVGNSWRDLGSGDDC